jgi:hypothetical protein
MSEAGGKGPKAQVVRFPRAPTRRPGSGDSVRQLGYGELAECLELRKERLTGHWCSRCKGLWCGALLEVACPTCGNRRG